MADGANRITREELVRPTPDSEDTVIAPAPRRRQSREEPRRERVRLSLWVICQCIALDAEAGKP